MGGGGRGGGGKGRGQESNVLLASVEEQSYPVTIEVKIHPNPRAKPAVESRGSLTASATSAVFCRFDIWYILQDLHRVFSLCGFVSKISTFTKEAGFQASQPTPHGFRPDPPTTLCALVSRWCHPPRLGPRGLQALIQYADIPTAVNAANTLENYTIFEGCCRLRISFSRHTELNVKFQSDRSRDYTVPPTPPRLERTPSTPRLAGVLTHLRW